MARTIASVIGTVADARLGDIVEVDCVDTLARLGPRPAALRFDWDGAPAWALWEVAPALEAIENILGSIGSGSGKAVDKQQGPRSMSPIEVRIFGDLLAGAAKALATGFEAEIDAPRAAMHPDALGSWRDGREEHNANMGGDPCRLQVDVSLTIGKSESNLRFLLPCARPDTADNEGAEEASIPHLPVHLAPVEVEVQAALPPCEVPLSDLLALEVGDVIPLPATSTDGPLKVALFINGVDGEPVLGGELGRKGARTVVRVQSNKAEAPSTKTENHHEEN